MAGLIFLVSFIRLPFDLDQKQISTLLSPDGILSVEAPLTGSKVALPDETVIPINMMDKPGLPAQK